MPILEKNIV